jgi:hypothetical protein
MNRHLFIWGIFLLTSLFTQAQVPSDQYLEEAIEQRTIDEERWSQIIEGIDYSESEKVKKRRERKEKEDRYEEMRDEEPDPIAGLQLLGNIALFLGVLGGIILLAFLLKGLLGVEMKPRDKKIKKKVEVGAINLASIEENIHETDLEGYIARAIQDGQYALAVRLYYLAILKAFSEAKLIHWKRDKTNRQYLKELSATPYAAPFAQATQIFEWAWYSHHKLSEADYQRMEPTFKNMIKQVKDNQ